MSALAHRSVYDQKVAEFLKDYSRPKTQQRYAQLAADIKAECEQLLNSMSIKGVVTSRTKAPYSLEKKLREMGDDREFRDWVSRSSDITEHQEMGDLAGIRFGLYLPDDVIRVAKEIKKRYQTKHLFGTVTGGRDATQDRNLDIEKHQNGPWYTRDANGAEEYWEHSGYKSWQMVVQPQSHGPKIEIQIGTVVTQAWAEVQHNIIYKKPDDVLATPTMRRMIDAVNGLAITTEIMLRELERSMEVAQKEAKEQAQRPFQSGDAFLQWFEETYMSRMRHEQRQLWVNENHRARDLVELCSAEKVRSFSGHNRSWVKDAPIPCPEAFKRLIERHQILETRVRTGYTLDISVLLLQAIGYRWITDEHTGAERLVEASLSHHSF